MARPPSPNPTDWELELLKILWDRGRSSVDEVRETLREQGIKRSDSAIRKVLLILVEKGLVTSDSEGRTSYYQAAIKRQRVERGYFSHLVQNLFGGSEEAFLLRALDETRLTPEVIKRMKDILQEKSAK